MSPVRQKLSSHFERDLTTIDQDDLMEIGRDLSESFLKDSRIKVDVEVSRNLSESKEIPQLFLKKTKSGESSRVISRSSSSPLRALSDVFIPYGETQKYAAIISIEFFGEFCPCGERVVQKVKGGWRILKDSQLDHIRPASAGHIVAAGNVRYLCKDCNGNLKRGSSYSVYLDRLKKNKVEIDKELELKRIKEFQDRFYFNRFPELLRFKDTVEHFDSDGNRIRIYEDREYYFIVYNTLMNLKEEGRLVFISDKVYTSNFNINDEFTNILYNFITYSTDRKANELRDMYIKISGKRNPLTDSITELEQIKMVYHSLHKEGSDKKHFDKVKGSWKALGYSDNLSKIKEVISKLDKLGYAAFHGSCPKRRAKVKEAFESFGYSESEIKAL